MTARQLHFTELSELLARGIHVFVPLRNRIEELAAIRPALNAMSYWQQVLLKGADV